MDRNSSVEALLDTSECEPPLAREEADPRKVPAVGQPFTGAEDRAGDSRISKTRASSRLVRGSPKTGAF